MTLPANDEAALPGSRTARQLDLDVALAAAAVARKTAAIARNNAARQLADYMAGELADVAVTPAESVR